jgi:glycerate-2-kinase
MHNTAAFLPPPPKGRTVVIGAGKAGGSMAQAVDALWPADAPLSGLVVTRYHHTPPRERRFVPCRSAGGYPHRGGRGRAPGARRRRARRPRSASWRWRRA